MSDTEYAWKDELIWCPSQCYCNVTAPDGTQAVLYLRWRWGDPWTGDIIVGPHGDKGEWHGQEIGFWRADQLDEAKTALIAAWERSLRSAATSGAAYDFTTEEVEQVGESHSQEGNRG